MSEVAEREAEAPEPVAIPTVAERLRVLSEAQAAALLGRHVQTLRVMRRERRGPRHIMLGPKHVGYRLGDIEAWLDGQRAA